jgi:hypothetical protein
LKLPNTPDPQPNTNRGDYHYDNRLWGKQPPPSNEQIRLLSHALDGNVDFNNIDDEIVGEGLIVTSDGPFSKKKIALKYSEGVPRLVDKGTGGLNIVVEDGQSLCIVNEIKVDGTLLPQSFSIKVEGCDVEVSNEYPTGGELLITRLQISSGPIVSKPTLRDGELYVPADKNVLNLGVPSS